MAMDALLAYGLLAVFILVFLDGALLLPGLPGELVLIIYVTIFQPSLPELFVLGAIGIAATMLSAIPLYMVGRATARNMARKKKRVFGMSPKMQERMQRLFSRPIGGVLLVFARLFLPTRAIVSIPAGIARMPFARFMIISLIGTIMFFVGYIWLIYEFQDPNSQVSQTQATLDEAYMSPAWGLVEANWIVAILGLIGFGIFLSIRASRRMARHAHETSGSIIGFVVRTGLFWGGAALLIAVWINNVAVYDFLHMVGIHPETLAVGLPGEPDTIIAAVALVALLLGMMLNSMRRAAREKNRLLRLEEEKLEFQKRLPEEGSFKAATAEPIGTSAPRRHPLVRRAQGTEPVEEATRVDAAHEETLRSKDSKQKRNTGL